MSNHDPNEDRDGSGAQDRRRHHSLLASFAAGTGKSKAAVLAAITKQWSNGQTEGQINKLEMVKRQMYSRAKIDLLEARLIGVE